MMRAHVVGLVDRGPVVTGGPRNCDHCGMPTLGRWLHVSRDSRGHGIVRHYCTVCGTRAHLGALLLRLLRGA